MLVPNGGVHAVIIHLSICRSLINSAIGVLVFGLTENKKTREQDYLLGWTGLAQGYMLSVHF